MDPLTSTSSLRPAAWLNGVPTPAHEKADENAVAGPPQDRTAIGGLKMRKRPAVTAQPEPAPVLTPVQDALGDLAQAGYKIVLKSDERIEQSFANKQESLVRLGAPYTMVASVHSVEELQTFANLATGQEVADKGLAETHAKLTELDSEGLSFYFARETGPLLGKLPTNGPTAWLRTNAAGAAILLARGESLRILGADGSEHKASKPADLGQVRTEGSAEKKNARELLDFLEGLGTRVEPDFPLSGDILASDYDTQYWKQQKMLLTSGREERPQTSDFLARGKMLKDLASGGEIHLTLPGETRSVTINRTQAEALRGYLQKATPADFDFNRGYEALTGAHGKVFARQLHGDAKGQLVECKQPLPAYLNLVVGGECVVLQPDGDLKTVQDLVGFTDVALGQGQNPEAAAHHARFQPLSDAGYVFYKPEQNGKWTVVGSSGTLAELSANRSVVVEKNDGTGTQQLNSLQDLARYAQTVGLGAAAPAPPVPEVTIDPATPKQNLVMVYYSALHNSGGPLGVYDDFALKLQQLGSSADRDLITLRSDQSFKENLRLDYVQPGRFENLQRLSPETMLSDAKVLENFVYESFKRHPQDEKARLIVLGHGSAEFGVMDDFAATPDGQVRVDRIEVDQFAGSIKKALNRIEAETGKRPVIDNLVLNSCLMGNASLLQALAETGDVRAMSASPELMLDSFPAEAISNLNGAVDGKDYARQLVDTFKDAGAFPGGRENRVNALVYGSYDCDPAKAATFKSSLKEFFAACTRRPDLATYIREDIQDCKGYNIHPAGGPGPGFENRDLIQVAKRIAGDARIQDKDIKAACEKLVAATRAQVLAQRAEEAYQDREGPSCFLPLNTAVYDATKAEPPTRLLKETGFNDFMAMVQKAAPRTQAHERALHRLYTDQGDAMVKMVMGLAGFSAPGQAVLEQEFVTKLERPVEVSRLRQGLNSALRVALGAVGGAVGLVLGVGLGLPGGALKGAVGGALGHSSDDSRGSLDTSRPFELKPNGAANMGPVTPTSSAALGDGTVLEMRSQNRQITEDAISAALEGVGTTVNKAVSYKHGNLAGKLVGVPVGLVGGAVTGSLVLGAGGAVVGWQLGQKLADSLVPRR